MRKKMVIRHSIILRFIVLAGAGVLGVFFHAHETAFCAEPTTRFIAPWKVKHLQAKGKQVIIIDVRGENLFKQAHIEGSINVPGFVVAEKGFPKEATFVLACGSLGSRESSLAAGRMSAAGYTKVYTLQGGLYGWEASGYPLIQQDKSSVPAVTANNLHWAIKNRRRIKIVDIRRPDRFKEANVPGSINIPVSKESKKTKKGGPAALVKWLDRIKKENVDRFKKEIARLTPEEKKAARPFCRVQVVVVAEAGQAAVELTRTLNAHGHKNVCYLFGGFNVAKKMFDGKKDKK